MYNYLHFKYKKIVSNFMKKEGDIYINFIFLLCKHPLLDFTSWRTIYLFGDNLV